MTRPMAEALELRRRRVCLICGAAARSAGVVKSRIGPARSYRLARCDECGFGFLEEPRIDFEAVYDAAYYRGQGADPLVAYEQDLQPGAVRTYEWAGIVRVIDQLDPRRPRRWLDFGCGYGGLVRFVGKTGAADEVVGFDYGHAADRAQQLGHAVLDEDALRSRFGTFDVVTAIEVLEHTVDPIATLCEIERLLAPAGILFVTTGNASRHRRSLDTWSYVIPEIHMSFFEPHTLSKAYAAAGLEPVPVGRVPGMTEIIRYKVLKSLRRSKAGRWERLIPWHVVSRAADWRAGVSEQPAARKSGLAR